MTRIIPTNFTGGTLSFNFDDINEQAETRFVNEHGDTMRGELNMNGYQIKHVGDPIDGDDVVTNKYLTDLLKDINKCKNESEKRDTNINKITKDLTSIAKKIEDLKIESDKKIKDEKVLLQATLLDEIKKTKEKLDADLKDINLKLSSVSSLERLEAYQIIQKMEGLKFWASGKYLKGFHPQGHAEYVNLGGENSKLHHKGPLQLAYNEHPCIYFNGKNNIFSVFDFNEDYTFFLLAKKKNKDDIGRMFTSSVGNQLLGWWDKYHQTLWMNKKFHIANHPSDNEKIHASDDDIHLWILRAKSFQKGEDTITFYDGDVKVDTSTQRATSKWHQVVIGQPQRFPAESLKGCYVYEVICFNIALSDTQINKIRTFIKRFYLYKNIK